MLNVQTVPATQVVGPVQLIPPPERRSAGGKKGVKGIHRHCPHSADWAETNGTSARRARKPDDRLIIFKAIEVRSRKTDRELGIVKQLLYLQYSIMPQFNGLAGS